MRMFISLGAACVLAACAGLVAGQPGSAGQQIWQPPNVIASLDPVPNPTVARELIPRLTVAGTEIVLDTTSLQAAQAALGGTIGRRGDAAESLKWLCFRGADTSGPWALWLESGEIHGGKIGGFELRRLPASAQIDDRCVAPRGEQSLALPVALQLGLGEDQLAKILGPPTVKRGDTLFYVHQHQETIKGQPFTASSVLAVVIRSGVVNAMQTWKMRVS